RRGRLESGQRHGDEPQDQGQRALMRGSRVVLAVVGVLAVAEIALLAWLGQLIGVWWTLLILVVGGVVGGMIARHEGSKAWASLREAQAHPEEASSRLTDAALVLTGGGLIALPGLITDVIGLVFIVPVTRPLARAGARALLQALTRPYRDQIDLMQAKTDPGSVVEGETVTPTHDGGPSPRRDDPGVIRGEIEP
ncbi:MAG: FxsA family protein, partial [Propioniciclava sp.]